MEAIRLPIRSMNLSRPRYYDYEKQFMEFVQDYLNKSHRSDRYKLMYTNTINHIREFCRLNGVNINDVYTYSIGMEFCENFVHYLKAEKNLMQNTVKGHLERLQAMLQKAMLYGYCVDNTYKEVTVPEEEVGAVFLSMKR